MTQDMKSAFDNGKMPAAAALQGMKDEENQPKGGFVILSAYALSLRSPDLFLEQYTRNPRVH